MRHGSACAPRRSTRGQSETNAPDRAKSSTCPGPSWQMRRQCLPPAASGFQPLVVPKDAGQSPMGIRMKSSRVALYTFGVFRAPPGDAANQGFHDRNDRNLQAVELSEGFVARSGYDDEPGPQ